MKNKKIENKLQQFFQLHHGWNGKFSLAPPKNNIQLISRIYDTITEWQHVVIEDVGVGDDGEVDLIWTIGDTRYYLTIHNSVYIIPLSLCVIKSRTSFTSGIISISAFIFSTA